MSSISFDCRLNGWKEVALATVGSSAAAASNVTLQYLFTNGSWLSTTARNLIRYSGMATSLAGAVLGVYSMVQLAKKITSDESNLKGAVAATALGVLVTSIAHTVGEFFWEIAPSFYWLQAGESLAYCIAANFGWQFAAVVGLGGIAITAYAAYRLGRAALDAVQDPVH